MTTREDLADLINDFLMERRTSDGGYPPVTKLDEDQLLVIVQALIRLKWESDPDGHMPMLVKLIDRTRNGPFHYVPVPYIPDGDEIPLRHLRMVKLNAALANSALDRMMDQIISGTWYLERE